MGAVCSWREAQHTGRKRELQIVIAERLFAQVFAKVVVPGPRLWGELLKAGCGSHTGFEDELGGRNGSEGHRVLKAVLWAAGDKCGRKGCWGGRDCRVVMA